MPVLLPVAYHVMVVPLKAETLEVQSGKMRGMSQQRVTATEGRENNVTLKFFASLSNKLAITNLRRKALSFCCCLFSVNSVYLEKAPEMNGQ